MNAARRRTEPNCEPCGDTRIIESRKLGRVRCPYCTVRKLQRTDWRPINAADKRRAEQAELSRTVVVDDFRFPNLPNHLLSTNRVLLRWGSEGSGMPSDNPDVYRESLPVPLDPTTHAEVSRIVSVSPRDVKTFAVGWYCSYNPIAELKRRLRVGRRQLERYRLDALHALKSRFLKSRHGDLVALVRFLPE